MILKTRVLYINIYIESHKRVLTLLHSLRGVAKIASQRTDSDLSPIIHNSHNIESFNVDKKTANISQNLITRGSWVHLDSSVRVVLLTRQSVLSAH